MTNAYQLMVNSRSIHDPFRSNFIKWWFRQMDSRMRIKKPAGKADFLAMIKGFDLFEFKNQTLFQKSEC